MASGVCTHTYTCTHIHTFMDESDCKTPGAPAAGRCVPGLKSSLVHEIFYDELRHKMLFTYCMDHVSFLQMPTQQIPRDPPDTSRLANVLVRAREYT